MTTSAVAEVGDIRSGPFVRSIDRDGWQLYLASFGSATATLVTGETPGVILAEEPTAAAEPEHRHEPRVEVRLWASGRVAGCSRCAPSIVLAGATGEVSTLSQHPGAGWDTTTVQDGAVMIAWTPAVLDALSANQVARAPTDLLAEPDPGALIGCWLGQGGSAGAPGGAVLVARRPPAAAGGRPCPLPVAGRDDVGLDLVLGGV